MSPEAEVRVTLDAVLADVNSRTLAALDRALPRSGADFLVIAVRDDERGRHQAACTAKRLRKARCEPTRVVLDRGGKGWRSYTIAAAAAACEVVGGDRGPFDDWLALPASLHVGSLIERHPSPAPRADHDREYVSLLRAGHAGQGLDLFGLRPPTPERAAPRVPAVLDQPTLCSRGHGYAC